MRLALDRYPRHKFGWIKGKKLKNLCQSLGFRLRLCKLAGDTENAPDPVSSVQKRGLDALWNRHSLLSRFSAAGSLY